MKFKQSDIGLYFAVTLVGAGVGLLIGSVIASKRQQKSEEELPEGWTVVTEDDIQEITEKKPSAKTAVFVDSDELLDFIERRDPTAMMIELIQSGHYTIAQAEQKMDEIEDTTEDEGYNYHSPYLRSTHNDPSEDDEIEYTLEDDAIPDDEDPIRERWVLSTDQPEGKIPQNSRVYYWDTKDDTIVRRTKNGNHIPIGNLDGIVPPDVWEVVKPYLANGFSPVYVDDLTTTKYVKLEVLEDDLDIGGSG